MLTTEQTQAIETALSTYWAGGEPDQALPAEWFSAYLDINCITEANLGLLIDRIYSSPFNAEYTLKHQTRQLAIELSVHELNELGVRVAEQSISDPGWLTGVLQRAGVLTGKESNNECPMHMLASLLNQAQIGQSVLPVQGDMPLDATQANAAVQSLRNLVSAAQNVWSGKAPLNLEDCKLLGVTSQASPLSDGQLERLNGILQVRRNDVAPQEQTFATFNALTRSVVALDNKLLGAPDGIDLSVSDFENLGVKGVTATNIAFINSQMGTLEADQLVTWETLQNLVDRQLADALSRIQTAIDQQQTAELTSGDLTVLGLQLPSTFSLEAFKALLATHRGLSNEDAEQQASSIEHLQALVQVSHKITQLKDNDPGNDAKLTINDLETLNSVAQLGWVMYDVQARDLFNDVLKNSAQRGAQMLVVGEIEQIASTVSDIHRLASGGRPRSPLTLDRLEFIGALQQDGLLHGDIVLQGLITVIARTESSGTGVDTLAELKVMATAYHHVIQRVVNPGHPYVLEEADYRALGLGTINSTSKARLLTDLLSNKTLQEVDSIVKLQGLADLAHKVVAYANAAPVVLTQSDLELMGITNLNDARTTQLLAELKLAGSTGELIDSLDKIQAMVDTAAPTQTISDIQFSADTGTSQTDLITQSTEQTITAKLSSPLQAGERLLGSVDGGVTWTDISASVNGNTVNWSTRLLNGTQTIGFKLVDAVGNESTASTVAYTVNTTPPLLSVTEVRLSDDTGYSSSDLITSAPQQTISARLGVALASGENLYGSVDGGVTWTNINTSTRGTDIQWTTQLHNGPNTICFKQVDAAGNSGLSQSTAYLLDTTVPSVSQVLLSADTGNSSTDKITNAAQQTITATLSSSLKAGQQLFGSVDGGNTWVNITDRVNGTTLLWSTQLLAGPHTLQFKVTDSAGNQGISGSTGYTLDTLAPSLSISNVQISADSGISSTDFITLDAQQTITARLSSPLGTGERLLGSVDSGNTWVELSGQVSGTSVTWSTQLLKGTHAIQFKVSDAAGNEAISAGTAYTLDPLAPSVRVSQVQFSADTGMSRTDLITSSKEQTVTGILANSFNSGDQLQGSVDGGATWTDITRYVTGNTIAWNTTLSEGGNSILFKVTNAAGREQFSSGTAYTVDTSAPGLSVTEVRLSDDTGHSATDFITRTPQQTISARLGVALASDEILYGSVDGGVTWTDISSSTRGTEIQWTTQLHNGPNTICFKQVDTAGNSSLSQSTAYLLDTVVPSVSQVQLSADTGASSTDKITNAAEQTITATLSSSLKAGQQLFGSVDGGNTWVNITDSVNGNTIQWGTTLLAGPNTLQFKVTDSAGNQGISGSTGYTLDTLAPSLSISNVQISADTGISSTDFITRVQQQTITATLSSRLEADEQLFGSVDAGKTWLNITGKVADTAIRWDTPLVSGAQAIRFKVTDSAGNEVTAGSRVYTLDTTPDSSDITKMQLSSDTGISNADFITQTAQQTITATLSAALESGAQLFGKVNDAAEWQNITSKVNGPTLTWNTTLTQGTHNIQFKVIDVAGNERLTNKSAYTLDTSPSSIVINHVSFDADAGISTTDRITNSAEQTISGTLSAGLEPGSRLYGRVNGSFEWQDLTANVNGTNVTWVTTLVNGQQNIQFKIVDAAGNESQAGTTAYTLDSSLPGISNILLSADTGNSSSDRITAAAKQTITAQLSTTLGAGDKLYGRVDGESDWQDITDRVKNNTLSWSGVTLRSGTNSVQLKLLDVAGNETITIQGYNLDTTPPPLRTIHGVSLSADSGWNAKDLITNVSAQTITANLSSAMAADEVLLGSIDGGKTWDNITSKVNGTSITWDGVTLLNGVNNLLFKIEDKAGNQAPSLSGGAQYTLDTAAPTQTIAIAPTLPDGVKTGMVTNDHNQEDVIATLDKVLEPHEMIYGSTDNGATWTHLTYRLRHYYQGDDQKKIHWEKVALHEGDNKLLYKVVDAAGNEKIIGTYDYSLNLSAPNISDIKLSADTGSSSADFVTQTAAQTITATLDKVLTKGSKLEAKVSTSDAWIDITSKVNGNQIVWDGALLKSGENAVCFKVTDAYGNSREYLNTTYTLDTSAPALTVDAKSVQIFNADGVFSTDRRTHTATQTVKGTLSAPLTSGDILYGSIDSGATWTDISGFVDGNNISWTGVTLRNGDHQIVFKVTDKAGNTSTPAEGASYTLISSEASVTDVKLSDDTGSSNSDRITNATAQKITATLNSDLASGQSIWGSVDNGGSWVDITHCVNGRRIDWEGMNLLDGSNTIRFKQGTDINSAAPTGIAEYLVDKTSMTPKVTAVVFSDDSNTAGDLVTKTATQATITVTLSSTLEAKGRIFGSVDNGQHWTELSHLVKGNSISWKGAVLQEGANNLIFKTVDVAGNEANAGSYSYGLYTQIPSITGLKFSADNGFSDSDFFTNTTKQTITATLSKPLSAGAKLEVSGDTGGSYIDITQYVKGTDLRFDYELPKKDALYLWSLVFKVTDKAGNVFEIGATPYAVETATPSLTVSNVTLSEDTGQSTSDLITARAVQTITATLSNSLDRPDSHNLLLGSLDSGQTWTDISAKVNGTKIVWTGATLHNGTHSIQFKVVDKGGAQGAVTGSTNYTLDVSLPSVRSVKDVSFSDDTGFSTSDLITKTSSQTIKATLSEKLGSTEKLWGSVNGGTTWIDITSKVKETAIQWDGATLVSGAQAIQFKVTTPSGAESLSNSVHYSLITAPPTISSITLGSDTGQNTNDLITNIGKQTVYATLSRDILPNEVLLGSVNGGKDWINITQAIKGNRVEWTGATLAEGNNSVVFKIDDLAGNTGTTNSIVCTLDTQAPGAPKLSVDNSGSVAVVTISEHAKESVLTYKIDFTDETGASRTITTQKVNGVWSASGLPEGANLSASTGTLRLNKDLIMDGSNVAVTVFDLAGNSSTVSKVASADSEPRPGDSLIDLGEFGTLIAPVQVEGKWYYHWDISGDGIAGNNDARSMNWLAENFFNSKTAGLITDSNRTFTVNGVTVRLSTLGGGSANANTAGTAYSKPDGDPEYNSNRVYNDLTAIWDAFNGTFEGLPSGSQEGTIVQAPGTPTGWTGGYYWSSSILPIWGGASHYQFSMQHGSAALIADTSGYGYFALEVLEPGTANKTIDSKTVRLSNDTGSSAIDRITNTAEQTILANFNADLRATDVLEASMDEGANWIRIPNNKISGSTLTWDKVTLSEGTHKILFRVTDEAGNKTLSPAINYTLDKTAPGVSAVTFSQDTGGSSSDRITSVAPQTVAVQFSEVLGVGSKVLGSVDGGITWSRVNGTATDTTIQWQTQLHGGSNRLIFKGEDAAGNAFTSTPFAYTLETSMPMASAVKLSADTGIANDLVTKVGAQTITATLSAALSSNQQLYGSTNAGNTWFDITSSVNKQAISWNTTLLNGANAIQFKVTDTSGSAVISGSTAYVLDVDRPTLNLSGIKLSTDTGPVEWQGSSQDFITSSSAQTVTATLGRPVVAGEQLLGSVNGGSSWLDITDKVKDQVLSWDKVALLSGKNSLQFKIADSAFNESDIIRTDYLLDTVAPTQTVSGVSLRFDTGSSDTDKVTNIAKQTINAKLSAALDTNDLLYGSVDNGATWVDLTQIVYGQTIEWSEPELLTGNSTIVFKVTDKAGNTSATKGLTGQTAYTVDLTAPTQTISNVKLSKDTGTNSSDLITSTAAQTISATLSAELTSSDRLFARLDKASTWTDITSSISNKTSIQWATTLNPGTHELEFKVIDLAGNEMITGQTQYSLNLDPTLRMADNGSLAVFAAHQPGNTYSYALDYTDENGVAQVITVSNNGSEWRTTGLPQTGAALLSSSGSLRLDKDQILDGSKVTIKMLDSLGSTEVASGTAGTDTTSLNGNSIIGLGAYGQLIAPVQVKGRWYYYWDTNGNGQADAADAKSMDWFESTFFGGNSTGSVVTDSNRTFTLNNVELRLPTLSSTSLKLSGTSYSSPIDDKAVSAGTVSLQTVWDAFNGTATTTDLAGTPPDWYKGTGASYATASSLKADVHQWLILETGGTNNFMAFDDSNKRFFALEVL